MPSKKSTSAKSAKKTAKSASTENNSTSLGPIFGSKDDPLFRGLVYRNLVEFISSENHGEEPSWLTPWKDEDKDNGQYYGNHFVWGASQVNTDLAQAAQCELEGDIHTEDPHGTFELRRAPQYWKLRQQFLRDAYSGNAASLLNAICRAYNAGRLCPDRLVPRTEAERLLDRVKMTPEEAQVEGMRRSRKEVAKAIESTY